MTDEDSWPAGVSGWLVEAHLTTDDLAAALAADVAAGLTSSPKQLPPKWFYDEVGSKLFEEITRLPEYYPTRREREILEARAPEIATLSGADTLVELGSGTSEKTRLLLDAFRSRAGGPRFERFVPFDVSEATLRHAAESVFRDYPGLSVHAVVGDFEHHLTTIPRGGRRLIAFLGGTIGNLLPEQRTTFLSTLASTMSAGDSLLLGTDLVKDPARLVAAYDDSAGVSAAFNANVLSVVNRHLNADFVPDNFAHVARFDPDARWMEMALRSLCDQVVRVGDLDLEVFFAQGEELRTEISAKFRRDDVARELAAAGLEMARWWTDGRGDFGLSLSEPVS